MNTTKSPVPHRPIECLAQPLAVGFVSDLFIGMRMYNLSICDYLRCLHPCYLPSILRNEILMSFTSHVQIHPATNFYQKYRKNSTKASTNC